MVRRLRCRVDSIVAHGEHVFAVDLVPEMRVPAFKPGQFLHLALDEYDPSRHWPESRVFSVASSPGNTRRIRILYSAVGSYTRRMEQELREGAMVWIKLPYGEFVVDVSQTAVLIAGGTGISAFTGFLEALPADCPRKVLLVHGTRTPRLMIYRETIVQVITRVPSFSAILLSEEPWPALGATPDPADTRISHRVGRIGVEAFWPTLENPLERIYYLSGPPRMSDMLSAALRERGVPPGNVRTDAWE